MRCHRCFALLFAVLATALLAQTSEHESPIDEALDALDLSRRDVTPDPYRVLLRDRDPLSLSTYESLLLRPFDASHSLGMTEEYLLRWRHSPHRLLMSAAGMWDARISRGYIGNPFDRMDQALVSGEDPIQTALVMIAGTEQIDGILELSEGLEDVPGEWRIEIARLMTAGVWGKMWSQRAYRDLGEFDRDQVLSDLLTSDAAGISHDYRFFVGDLDREAVMGAALDVAMLVEDFVDFARSLDEEPPPFDLRIQTPAGKVRVSTVDRNDTVDDGPYLLSVDWYGDDLYGPSFTSGGEANPASILIDWSGSDRYLGSEGGMAPCSGFFGTGYLHDEQGDDLYEGTSLSSAGAFLGVSVLVDSSGDDRHEARSFSQASAVAGVALLLDSAGDDRYEALTTSQASGGPLGVAMLIDVSGDDSYSLRAEPLLYPSPQKPTVNTSLGQGCGYGLRADLSDGKSVAGGIGILIEPSGDDHYLAGVFAQGAGFLGGAGILMDDAGDDDYHGVWYVQGASAHRALGFLMDRAGNDRYFCEELIGQGAAHDFSTSIFLDLKGDDSYSVNRLGLGTSNENSVALFIEGAGDDVYEIRQVNDAAFGSARVDMWGGARENSLGVGLFFDLGGEDVYRMPRQRGVGNNSDWRNVQTYEDLKLRAELGFGLDREDAKLPVKTGALTPPSVLETRYFEEAIRARRAYRSKATK